MTPLSIAGREVPRRAVARRASRCRCPGAINAYHAILAEKSGLPRDLPVRRRRRRRLARPARSRHQQPRRRADRRAPHHRRVRAAAAGRRRHRLRRERVQHRAHGEVADQVRRRRDAHRGPGRREALRPPAGQGDRRARTRWSTAIKAAVDAKTDADFVVMARTDALAVEGLEAAIERARRLRRGRRRHDLPRGDHRARDVPALRRRGEGADPREHHRVRRDAAVHGRRAAQRRTSRSRSIRCRRSAR